MKKQITRNAIIILAILLIVMQFFRPERNTGSDILPAAIAKQYPVSEEIQGILRTSCYDCHSNHTDYPWYSNIQPFAWWQQSHVNEGKRELNFDEFGSYNIKKQKHKLDEFMEVITENEMPLSSYTLLHRSAVLTPEKKAKLLAWAKQLQQQIK